LFWSNLDDSNQRTVSETVNFYVKTATFCNIVLFWKVFLREKLFLSWFVTKQGLVAIHLFVLKQPTCYETIFCFEQTEFLCESYLFPKHYFVSESLDSIVVIDQGGETSESGLVGNFSIIYPYGPYIP
jgi:hypothetical protein